MVILVACEESQRVAISFREKGHEAYSCDMLSCSGGHPEFHIIGNVLSVIEGYCSFLTQDGTKHRVDKWDMIIAHPPCTDIAVSGAKHFEQKRIDGRQRDAVDFFCKMLYANSDKVVVENPVNIISGEYVKKYFPDLCKQYNLPIKCSQIIQPYEFGEYSKKATCLWIKGLPLLKPTEIVEPKLVTYTCKNGKKVTFSADYGVGFKTAHSTRRSKTFWGIAKAMAEQWG